MLISYLISSKNGFHVNVVSKTTDLVTAFDMSTDWSAAAAEIYGFEKLHSHHPGLISDRKDSEAIAFK